MTCVAELSRVIGGTVGSCAMEELDRQIVQLLVKDGRMSYTDLGKATGLSTSAVHQRVRRLRSSAVSSAATPPSSRRRRWDCR